MSSIFSILSAGAPGQTPVAGQTPPLEPPGVAFETFLLTAQDRVEYPPAAAPGASTPPEAQERTSVTGQSGLQGDLSFESAQTALPSNGLLDPSLHLLPLPEGTADDDLTAWEDNPAQGRLPAPGAVLSQKGRSTASDAREKGYVSDPLAPLLSPSGPGEAPARGELRDREANPSGDGGSGASSASETSWTTPVFQEEKNEPAAEPSLFASPFTPSRVEPPAQGRATWTETVERDRETEAQAAETGPSDPRNLPPPTRALPHPAADPLPETEAAGVVAPEATRPARSEDAGGTLRSLASKARRDETAGDETGALSENHPGQVPVRDAREVAPPGLTSDGKPSKGVLETPPTPGPPQRKGTKTETLSAGTPPGDASQNTPLTLLMQPPPPAPASGERADDTPPEMAGVRRTETRNPLPPPLEPTPERPAFAPVPEIVGAIGDRPEVVRATGDSPQEGTRARSPETIAGAIGDRPEVVRATGDRPQEGIGTAAPAQGTPDGKVERPSDSRPANAPVTARKIPVAGAFGDRPVGATGGRAQEGHDREAGQAIAAPVRPPEMGMVRPSGVKTDGESAASPAGSAARPSGVRTDDRPSATAAPLETQGRAAERTTPFNGEVERAGEQTRATGAEKLETQGRTTEKAAPFHREVERAGEQTRATGVQRPEQREGSPPEGLSDPASSRTERVAPGERHEGKSDRRDAQEGEPPTADQAVPFSSHPGDPVSLKTPPESSSVSTASAQHQSAISAAGPSPAGARVHTPEAAPAGIPDHPPEAVVRQVIRGARFLLKEDVSEVRVRLEPPELGSVHIRLISGGDTLSGEIGVSNPDVKGIVESHLHQLRSSLTEQGLHVGHIDVSVRDDQRGGAWPDRTGEFGHPGNAPDDRRNPGRNGSPAWEAPEENQRPRRSQSLVDYFA